MLNVQLKTASAREEWPAAGLDANSAIRTGRRLQAGLRLYLDTITSYSTFGLSVMSVAADARSGAETQLA